MFSMITHYVNTYFRSLFVQLDLKQDGRIDADELSSGLHKMGYSHLTQVNIQLLIREVYFYGYIYYGRKGGGGG